jgi:hypothetical protein
MPSWQHWAVLVIKELLFRSATALAASDHLAIYQLSNKCSAEILRKKIVEKWLKRIALGDMPISDALDAAEAHNDRDFLTSLYTFQLTQIPATAPTLFQATALGMDGISPLHIQRLLAGYWSLSLSWTQFRQNIPALPRVGTCAPDRHDTICKPAFKSRWDNVVTDAEKASITKLDVRIDTMYRHLNYARLSGVAEPLCLPRYSEVVEPLMNIRRQLPKTLEAHFFGRHYVYHQ